MKKREKKILPANTHQITIDWTQGNENPGTSERTRWRNGLASGSASPGGNHSVCARSSFADATSNHLPPADAEKRIHYQKRQQVQWNDPGLAGADYDDDDGGKDRPTAKKKEKKKLLRKTECGRIPSSTDTDLVSWMWNVDLWELRGERAKMVGISRRTSNWHTTLGSSRTSSSSSSTFYLVVVVGDNLLGLKDDGGFIVTPFVWTV